MHLELEHSAATATPTEAAVNYSALYIVTNARGGALHALCVTDGLGQN